jgi:hypothetical protein
MPGTRIRSLKPEFFTSPSTAEASFKARLLYMAMWCCANDYGFGETNLHQLMGVAFPESDGITLDELKTLLAEIAECYETVFYDVKGRHYYWIPTWFDHNRPAKRQTRQWCPPPTDPLMLPDLRFHCPGQVEEWMSGKFREIPGSSQSVTGELGN